VATVNLIAIWAMLGAGRWFIRFPALLGVPYLIALGMASYSAYLRSTFKGNQNYGSLAWAIADMEKHWTVWLFLDAALLAALLLMLRESGFRLMRRSR